MMFNYFLAVLTASGGSLSVEYREKATLAGLTGLLAVNFPVGITA